jgi:hypothetical protein
MGEVEVKLHEGEQSGEGRVHGRLGHTKGR